MSKYSNLIKLSKYSKRYIGTLIGSIVCGVMNYVSQLVSLLLGAYLTGLAIGGAEGSVIVKFFPYLLGFILAKGLFAYLHMLIAHELAYLVLEDLRGDVFDAIERGAPLTSLKYRTGDVSSIIMEDVETLETFFAHIFGDYMIAIICMLSFLVLCLTVSWEIALLMFVSSCIITTIPYWFSKENQKNGKNIRTGLGLANARIVDAIQGLTEIIIFGKEKSFTQKISKDTADLSKHEMRDGKLKGLEAGIIDTVSAITMIAVILLSHSMTISGRLDNTLIAPLIILAMNIFLPVIAVTSTAGKISLTAACADRVYGLIHEPSPIKEYSKDERATKFAEIETENILDVKNISFSYDKENPVLKNLNVSIKKNDNVVITGESGAGKTTLMNLLLRFYDPDEGTIYLNGKDIRSMRTEDLRKNISYVSQDVYLFNGSIAENLKLGNPEASDEEMIAAAKTALADEFITKLEGGYKARVGERGMTLSGGQKQRVAIARALLTNAPILIMDEAVSNLDSESERLFRKALENIKNKKTIITVAHRPSTISAADRRIHLEDGKIVDSQQL